jgi:hypothetical protein
MRQPDITALRTLIAAIPTDTLPAVMLALMLDGATTKALSTPATPMPAKRRGGWPAGRKRGRPSKAAAAALARQRLRDAAAKRERRAAKIKVEGTNGHGAGNGNGHATAAQAPTAEALWAHATLLQPKAPYRAIARETGVNLALSLDAQRTKTIPPGLGAEAAAKFLEVPVN